MPGVTVELGRREPGRRRTLPETGRSDPAGCREQILKLSGEFGFPFGTCVQQSSPPASRGEPPLPLPPPALSPPALAHLL